MNGAHIGFRLPRTIVPGSPELGEGIGVAVELERLGIPVGMGRGALVNTVTKTVLVTVTRGMEGIGGLELEGEGVG